MAALKVLKNMRAKLDKTLEVLLIILMGFMVLNVLWQVFLDIFCKIRVR